MWPRRGIRLCTAAAATVLLAAGCGESPPVDVPVQPLSASSNYFFSGENLWTTPVPADAPADPDSARYVAGFAGLEPVVTIRDFAVSVYVAAADAPRFTIMPTAPRTPPGFAIEGVPIPDHIDADSAAAGHVSILDSTSNCVYELYGPRRQGDGWTADWVNATPADGDGVFPDGLSARASGLASAAGLIWPEEIRAESIPHALVFAYPLTRAGGPVDPATRSDGRNTEARALPLGARLVLDPDLDLDALRLPPAERAIAVALQRYGMILGDTSNGFSLYAVHPDSFTADPYFSTWGAVTYAELGMIPFDRMKVLPLGEQKPAYQGPPISNRCTATSLVP